MSNETDDSVKLSPEVRDLLAQRQDAKAKVLESRAELALKEAEVLKIKSLLLREDTLGSLSHKEILRW